MAFFIADLPDERGALKARTPEEAARAVALDLQGMCQLGLGDHQHLRLAEHEDGEGVLRLKGVTEWWVFMAEEADSDGPEWVRVEREEGD